MPSCLTLFSFRKLIIQQKVNQSITDDRYSASDLVLLACETDKEKKHFQRHVHHSCTTYLTINHIKSCPVTDSPISRIVLGAAHLAPKFAFGMLVTSPQLFFAVLKPFTSTFIACSGMSHFAGIDFTFAHGASKSLIRRWRSKFCSRGRGICGSVAWVTGATTLMRLTHFENTYLQSCPAGFEK